MCGGGPAGTSAALTAVRLGARVLLLERGRIPRHKVCGEFISAESLSLLASLLRGGPTESVLRSARHIHRARIFADGRRLEFPIQPAAASISRHDLDYALWQAAAHSGLDCRQQTTVWNITSLLHDGFRLATTAGTFRALTVIDASGRWSNLRSARADPPQEVWLGLKAHFVAADDCPAVDLYFLDGGYCGVQPVAPGRLNVAAMISAAALSGGRQDPLQQVFASHPRLQQRSRTWTQATDLVATSPLRFDPPIAHRGTVLCAGDAAGFVDPFVGDGISLALQTGVAAAQALQPVWQGKLPIDAAVENYRRFYDHRVQPVFATAARVRRLATLPKRLRRSAATLLQFPGALEFLMRMTRVRCAR